MHRRLAAILAADIAGYSAQMAEDEAGTLEALRRLRRELFHPAVAGHRGRIVKNMGDGWLVEFASAVDAANCAIRIQTGLEADPKIRVRIGIHVGDVTHEDEDIYGDGVNVAARLEAMADPGAIAISDAVYGSLDGTLTPSFDDAGEQALKNIPRPVRVWMRHAEATDLTPQVGVATATQRAGFPIIVAIRPVATTDERAEVRELAAALTNDLYIYLDNGRWLAAEVSERRRDDSYVLTVNLRGRGDRLRLEASVTGHDGALLWSQRLDGNLDESFDWQDETAANVASGTRAAILDAETARLARLADREKTAADWLLVAMMVEKHGQLGAARTALAAIEKAIVQDPEWGLPYAYGAYCCDIAKTAGLAKELDTWTRRVDEWIEEGNRHAEGDLLTELYVACAEHRRRPALEMLKIKINAVLRRYPYHETALAVACLAYVYGGEARSAVDCARKRLISVSDVPESESANRTLGAAYIMLGRDEEAVEVLRMALEANPDSTLALRTFASAAALAGKVEDARAAIARVREISPSLTVSSVRNSARYVDTPQTRRFFEGLRLAGLPEGDT